MAMLSHWHRGRSAIIAGLLGIALLAPQTGWADTKSALGPDGAQLLDRIEQTTEAYRQAADEVSRIEADIVSNEQRTAEIEGALPAQRARTASAVKSMYLLQQSSGNLLTMILSSEDFEDFIRTLRYMDYIHAYNVSEIMSLQSMSDELTRTRALLDSEREAAVEKAQAASAALEQARAARAELQSHAMQVALDESSDREQAIAFAKAAIEQASSGAGALPTTAPSDAASASAAAPAASTPAAPATASAETPQQPVATFTTASGNVAEIKVPDEPSVSTEPLVTNTTAQESIDWASRLDSYLAGSALEGMGQTFADAASKYGVDPRLSPAIATVESGKGEICFQEHNAWGWGDSSWHSWEEAIDEQVKGLATIYDGTLTLDGAQTYCPDNYQEWYSSVASEMNDI